jgi:hypothetical protein|tara:strand:+ start:4155 stop:4493 length:339 start_codon:yes stop_codon:yes gene_type:complete
MILTMNEIIDNASLQFGDSLYYVNTTTSNSIASATEPVFLGQLTSFDTYSLNIDGVDPPDELIQDSYLMFSKDKRVNTSRIKGYYASVTLTNNSTSPAELFAVSAEVTESSK